MGRDLQGSAVIGNEGQPDKYPLTGGESALRQHVKGSKASAGKGWFQGRARFVPAGT